MSELTRTRQDESGFTLPELLITIVILGVIVFGLTGTVIRFLQDTADTQGRFSESHDVQFASAYWQRDVASIGVRSTTYDDAEDVHSYPLVQSVNVTPACSLPGGSVVGTLAWGEYSSLTSSDAATRITVTYIASGSGPYTLVRVKCTGASVDSTTSIANKLSAVPTMVCTGPGGSSCTGEGANVPTLITLSLTAEDAGKRHGGSYTATLTGERRQS